MDGTTVQARITHLHILFQFYRHQCARKHINLGHVKLDYGKNARQIFRIGTVRYAEGL